MKKIIFIIVLCFCASVTRSYAFVGSATCVYNAGGSSIYDYSGGYYAVGCPYNSTVTVNALIYPLWAVNGDATPDIPDYGCTIHLVGINDYGYTAEWDTISYYGTDYYGSNQTKVINSNEYSLYVSIDYTSNCCGGVYFYW
jgi:hypothetical protein